MKVIIAGSRDLPNGMLRLEKAIEKAGFKITEVVSGNAPGVDRLGEFWAKTWGIPCTVMPADWDRYPKTAGTLRNTQMADYADALIAVWDGVSSGTKNMIKQAHDKGLKVYVDAPPKKVYHDDTPLPQNELSIDIETFSAVDLKKCGVHRYCKDPSFEVMTVQYAFGEGEVSVVDLTVGEELPEDFVKSLYDPTIIKNAFNAAFEITCLSEWLVRGNVLLQPLDPAQWRCTSVRALMHGLPNSLGEVCEVVGMPADLVKDMRGHGLIRRFCMPVKPTKANGRVTRNTWRNDPTGWEDFKRYGAQDVVAERELKRRLLKHDQGQFEWDAWALDLAINDRGVRVDMDLVDNAIRISDAYREKLMTEARRLTGLSNPNSVKQLLAWFQEAMEEEQEELDPWASEEEYFRIVKLDKKTLPQILQNTQDETIKRVVRLRQELGRTSVAKYKAIKRAVCVDGRVHGMIQFYGANRTGRAAGRIVQMQNLRSNKLKDLALAREIVRQGHGDLIELFWGDVPDVLSQLIRTAFIPDEGDELTVVDEKAIEARVIAWLANEEWRLEVFKTHGMIYEASASQMFHIPMEEFLAYDARGEKHPLRQKGKIAELALGFQGGPNALISMGALEQGLTEEELPEIVRLWRAANLGISAFPDWETGLGGGLWARFGDAALKAVQNFSSIDVDVGPPGLGVKINFTRTKGYLKITLPSGRKLTYVKPRIEIDPVYGRPGVVFEGVNQETKKWGKIRTFGGKITENIVQAIARDCLYYVLQKLKTLQLLFHVHDEAVMNSRKGGQDLKLALDVMGREIEWAPGLPLAGDGHVLPFYMKKD